MRSDSSENGRATATSYTQATTGQAAAQSQSADTTAARPSWWRSDGFYNNLITVINMFMFALLIFTIRDVHRGHRYNMEEQARMESLASASRAQTVVEQVKVQRTSEQNKKIAEENLRLMEQLNHALKKGKQ